MNNSYGSFDGSSLRYSGMENKRLSGLFSSYNEASDLYRIISVNPEQHYGAGANTAKMRFNCTSTLTIE